MPFNGGTVQIPGSTLGLETMTVDMPLSGGEQGTLEAFGIDDIDGRGFALTSYRNGQPIATAGFSFANVRGPKSGSNGPLSRVRAVSLQDYTSLWDVPAGDRSGVGLPPVPPRFQAVLYDIDKPLGSDLPDDAECEEKRRAGSASASTGGSNLLQSLGMDVLIKPGPGFVPRVLEDDFTTDGKSISQVLSELLFTNGVRWWLEGNLVVVDGRALPQGSFSVPLQDRLDVREESWEDDFADFEAEPSLADYIGRCVENAETEDGTGSTFETLADGEYPHTEASGSQGPEGDYVRTDGTATKAGGQLVKDESVTHGYVTRPNGRFIGRTQQTYLENSYHVAVPQALVKVVERKRTYADFGLIQNLQGEGQGSNDLQLELWNDLQAQSPYISSETVTVQRWNAEGLLRAKVTTGREFAGLLVVQTASQGKQLRLLYKDAYKQETWLPVGGGTYWYTVRGYITVDVPAYEAGESAESGAEPTGIMGVRQPFFEKELTDSPPPSVSMPLPSCEEMDDCLNRAQREYARDHADWVARQINGVSTRTHRVAFNGLKLGLKRGQDYGGGRIMTVSHRFGRQTEGSTEVTVAVGHAE